jgi:hypothetical protein
LIGRIISTTADDQALDIASCSTDAVIAYTGMIAGYGAVEAAGEPAASPLSWHGDVELPNGR